MIGDIVDKMIAWESGDISGHDLVKLFSYLIETGKAWSLQGSYGRAAEALINAKVISDKGKILIDLKEDMSFEF